MNPKTRIKVTEALEHGFLENLHDIEDEPVFEGTIDFSFETDPTLDLVKIQHLIIREISYYNPEYERYVVTGDEAAKMTKPAAQESEDATM